MAIGVKFFTTPHRFIVPRLKDGKFQGSFKNKAQFTHGAGETCANGEYRQYVKGQLKVNGSVLTTYTCEATGAELSDVVYQEDGGGPKYGCTAYGYRACPTESVDEYTPHRETGCNYAMFDTPGFNHVERGKTYVIHLTFKGDLIDKATGAILETHKWAVRGRKTVRAVQSKAVMAGLQASDRIRAVRTGRNTDTGAAEVHVVLTRREGELPLDPACIKLTLTDARGLPVVPISSPAVYEVSGRGRATASFVYRLPEGSHAPVKAELSARGTVSVMDVDVR